MRRTSRATKLFATILVVLTVLAMSPAIAQAATKKTIKNQNFTTKTAVANKKATKISKKGTYNLKLKGIEGYIVFTAPKTATYTFTFSNFKNSVSYDSSCLIETQTVSKYDSSNIFFTDVKTQGGKANTLYMSVNGHKGSGSGISLRRSSRYARIKLKKNQKLYFYTYTGTKGMTGKLKITSK